MYKDVGMTGEITLRGRVLPIGGVREKILAAHRAGLKTVLLPERNMKDLVDVPKKVRDDLKIVPVTHMDQVLEMALHPPWRNQTAAGGHPLKKTTKKAILKSEIIKKTAAAIYAAAVFFYYFEGYCA